MMLNLPSNCIITDAQNKKYRRAIGNTFAGSHVSNSPSAQTR
jgi:hypothetical protein